jgi:hypothetical protein
LASDRPGGRQGRRTRDLLPRHAIACSTITGARTGLSPRPMPADGISCCDHVSAGDEITIVEQAELHETLAIGKELAF